MLTWKSLLCLNCTSALSSLFNMFISLSTSLQQTYHVKIDLRGSGIKARKYDLKCINFDGNMELIVFLTATLLCIETQELAYICAFVYSKSNAMYFGKFKSLICLKVRNNLCELKLEWHREVYTQSN